MTIRPVVLGLLFLLPQSLLLGGDVEVAESPVPSTSFAQVKYKLAKGDSVIWEVSPTPTKSAEFTVDGYSYLHFNGTPGKYTVTAFLVNFDTKKFERKKTEVQIGKAPQPPPGPVDPDDPVLPDAPKGFRVIFVYESGDPLPPDAQRVMYGEEVVKYLESKVTNKGLRRFDPNVDAVNEKDPEIKDMWGSVKPLITKTPVVAIAVNGKVSILDLPPPETAVEFFKKYAEGK